MIKITSAKSLRGGVSDTVKSGAGGEVHTHWSYDFILAPNIRTPALERDCSANDVPLSELSGLNSDSET